MDAVVATGGVDEADSLIVPETALWRRLRRR